MQFLLDLVTAYVSMLVRSLLTLLGLLMSGTGTKSVTAGDASQKPDKKAAAGLSAFLREKSTRN